MKSKTINPTELKEQYKKWLQEEISIKQIDKYFEITSPFIDRYNDYLQVYAKLEKENKIVLTDDSYIIHNLQMSGIDIAGSSKRKQLLENFLNKYHVSLEGDALVIRTGVEDFPQKLFFLMQAMLNVDDMFMLSQNKVAS